MTDEEPHWAAILAAAIFSIEEQGRMLREERKREIAWLRASLQSDNAPEWLIQLVIQNWTMVR